MNDNTERRFPVLGEKSRAFFKDVPFDILAPHERQALANHDQTLKRLAERGGLDLTEMVAILEDRRWEMMPLPEAAERVRKFVDERNRAAIAGAKGETR